MSRRLQDEEEITSVLSGGWNWVCVVVGLRGPGTLSSERKGNTPVQAAAGRRPSPQRAKVTGDQPVFRTVSERAAGC